MKMPRLTKKHYAISGILVLVGLFVFWRLRTSAPVYDEYTVETRDIQDVLELSGKVSASGIATLRFAAGGFVTYVGAQEGDQVKKWATLASIDTRQLQKILEQKLNLYAIERGTFDQVQDDYHDRTSVGNVDQELRRILEKNQYELENTVKDVEYQDLALKLARINSPIDGILVHSPVTVPFVQVAATDNWIVVDPLSLEFLADLDETEIARVRVGQKVTVVLDAYKEDKIETSIAAISYAPKETTTGTTYEVKLKLPREHMDKLRVGLNGTALVVLSEKAGVLTLPTAALKLVSGSSAVTVLEQGKYVTKNVVTGIENDGLVELVSGLGAGEHVYLVK